MDKEIGDLIEDIAAQSPSFRCGVLEAKVEWLEERLQELQKKINDLGHLKDYDAQSVENASWTSEINWHTTRKKQNDALRSHVHRMSVGRGGGKTVASDAARGKCLNRILKMMGTWL